MEDYRSNSFKSRGKEKTEKKKFEKVVTGPVKTHKKSGAKKLIDVIIAEDLPTVMKHLGTEVLVPAFKKVLSDTFHNGVDMLLYGETGVSKPKSPASRISYNGYFYNQPLAQTSFKQPYQRAHFDSDSITIQSEEEARAVLMQLDDAIATYGSASLADFYDLVGITCEFTDNNYGWTNIHSATIVRTREGYVIKMPKLIVLD